MHEIAAEILEGAAHADDRFIVELDDEQRDVVTTYIDLVRNEVQAMDAILFVEQVVRPPVHPDFFGTADAVLVSKDQSRLKIIDLKCGRGVPVEVDYNGKINPQIGYYLIGALHRFIPEGHLYPEMEAIIVQPRAGGIKRRKVTPDELTSLSMELVEAAAQADHPTPPFTAGDWCKFCPAAAICPTLQKAALEAAQLEFADEPPMPEELGVLELADKLNKASIMKKWIHAIEEHAMDQLKHEFPIPGWTLKPSRPYARWKDENSAAVLLRDLGVSDYYKKQELVSPAQAKRLVEKLGWDFDAQLGEVVSRESSGVRLIREAAPDGPPEDDFAE
jgi:hypothetical protein